MELKNITRVQLIGGTILAFAAFRLAASVPGGGSQAELVALEADKKALQQQLAAMGPSTVVQAGQLHPVQEAPQTAGWDTEESRRGGLRLFATYDSGGPDAWDVAAHPMVYFTSEGRGYDHRPSETNELPGVQVLDAYTKEVVTSTSFDLGYDYHGTPHGLGVSPDGRWIYVSTADGSPFAAGQDNSRLMIINARTLKLDKILNHPLKTFHHFQAFKDWEGRDRVVVNLGFGSDGGPHFILDPDDDNRVARAITIEDTGYRMGHPYTTPDPTGRFVYVSLVAPPWQTQLHETAGIAKLNLETGAVIVIPYVGDHPIGIAHTADGRFTYVVEGHASYVYKIDNETNRVVDRTSAGVAGPYGLALNWDESEIWVVGKGEGSHNTGGVMGVIDVQTFQPSRSREFNQPVYIGGATIDHAILHPDPDMNELWVSSAGTWETIVIDLSTYQVKARIPSPNGGDTHSGAFVRYTSPNFQGELLADMGGVKSQTVRDLQLGMIRALDTTTGGAAPGPAMPPASVDVLAQGRLLFERGAGGVGCAYCHGLDGRGEGTSGSGAVPILGMGEPQFRSALIDVSAMTFMELTEAEISAVVAYVEYLSEQR